MRRLALSIPLVVAALLAAGAAEASQWPTFGGDFGRSGYQGGGEGRAPIRAAYAKAEESERGVRTSIVTSSGQPANQRLAYGTANGRLHVQVLESGAPVGPEEGALLDDGDPDADVFTGQGGSVGLVDSSGPGGLGQIFAVHNDDNSGGSNDLAIAQVDETTGALVQDLRVPGSRDYTVSSSPVITDAAPGTSDRVIFFVANDGTRTTLFRVPIAAADNQDAIIGAITTRDVVGANPVASPTLVTLNDAAGTPTEYVAVASRSINSVQTFTVAGVAATAEGKEVGPRSGDLGGPAQTPSTPPAGADTAASLLVAVGAGESGTVVHALAQSGNDQNLMDVAASGRLEGTPAPALALTPTRAVVTTAANLHLLAIGDLDPRGALGPAPLSGGTGFGRTTAAASGSLVYVTRDNGQQLVLGLGDAQPLARRDFQPSRLSSDATAAYGQPAIASGFVQLGSDAGVFVYRTRCGNAITGTRRGETLRGTSAGDEVHALGGEDRVHGLFGDDCLVGGGRGDRLIGGVGGDELSGGGGGDVLDGGAGPDRLTGGSGADVLRDGGGANTFSAGGGDDRLDAVNGRRDDIRCGAGSDVLRADRADRPGRDCEAVRLASP